MTARQTREEVAAWRRLLDTIAGWPEKVAQLPVATPVDPSGLRRELQQRYQFDKKIPLDELTDQVLDLFTTLNIQVTHPRYFGLFNPSVLPAGVLADALAAVMNPQLAVWSHAPAANELERLTLGALAARLGLPAESHANFATGGGEANQSALIVALAHRYPAWPTGGLAALPRRPVVYVTSESHHTIAKGCKIAGLGLDAVRQVPLTDRWDFDVAALSRMVAADRSEGLDPFMVVGTAGTTSAGQVDPLTELSAVARRERLWFHVDAAWGGAAVLSDQLRSELAGIELADSVTWDAHKWLSVPMGAGMFFCRHADAVARAFAIDASYMPPPSGFDTVDPFVTTMQWTRRTIGLKVFMSLASLGFEGYARLIEHQARLGDELRAMLTAAGWQVVNHTRLPTVCFTHPDLENGSADLVGVLNYLLRRGKVWISSVTLGGEEGGQAALRATITSYRSSEADLEVLIGELEAGRRAVLESAS